MDLEGDSEEDADGRQETDAQAGITEPFRQLDVVQLHDCFTLTELLSYEDLGL